MQKINSKITFTVMEGKVVDISNGHGLAYKVQLPKKDYRSAREIWVDEEEVVNVYEVKRPHCTPETVHVYAQNEKNAVELVTTLCGVCQNTTAKLVKPKIGRFISMV